MAPQATMVVPTGNPAIESSALPTPAPENTRFNPDAPGAVLLFIFLGLCFAYTLSYVLYRIVMSCRRGSKDVPDSPDRGVSQFMNGTRLTVNFGHTNRLSTLTLSESPDTLSGEKSLADPAQISQPELPATSPAESSPMPFIVLTPSFSVPPNQDKSTIEGDGQALLLPASSSAPALAVVPTQQPFAQRVAAKVKFLSHDRAEAIALDPKLKPVQGPLRPLSMVSSPPPRKRSTLFGLGLKSTITRGQGEDQEKDSSMRLSA